MSALQSNSQEASPFFCPPPPWLDRCMRSPDFPNMKKEIVFKVCMYYEDLAKEFKILVGRNENLKNVNSEGCRCADKLQQNFTTTTR